MKIFKLVAITVAIIAAGVIVFAYSGIYDVGASSPHTELSNWFMSTTSRASIARRAVNIDVPDLGDEDLVLAGINDFDAMCTDCHGAPGREPAAVGQGLNPPAPDLAVSAGEMSPEELFWVTKHGIKMTGMPSWGATHDDEALWPVVALMKALPDLDAAGYEALKESAGDMGHHGPGEESVHSVDESADLVPVEEHDHSTHTH